MKFETAPDRETDRQAEKATDPRMMDPDRAGTRTIPKLGRSSAIGCPAIVGTRIGTLYIFRNRPRQTAESQTEEATTIYG